MKMLRITKGVTFDFTDIEIYLISFINCNDCSKI